MLDRVKVLKSVQSIGSSLSVDIRPQRAHAKALWAQAVADPLLIHKIAPIQAPWPVPLWSEPLETTVPICGQSEYRLLSIDGSQVYPDRHMGMSCYLINIGTVFFQYGPSSSVVFDSHPYVFTQPMDRSELGLPESQGSTELVNGRRQDLELRHGCDDAQRLRAACRSSLPFFLLYDGSLIFWHLESKTAHLQNCFLPRYLNTLAALADQQILTASYISAPKSRELVNILRLMDAQFDVAKAPEMLSLQGIVDTHLVQFFLSEYHRTTVFQNRSSISQQYPKRLAPYFFYLHVGTEIARVEIPAWVAADEAAVNVIAGCLLDQARKGEGYPIALAEAHEQAVVKGADREFFYQIVTAHTRDHVSETAYSPKLVRKRSMYV